MVLRAGQLARTLSVGDSAVGVAASLGDRRSEDRDRGRQSPQFAEASVGAGICRRRHRFVRRRLRPRERCIGGVEPVVNPVEVAFGQTCPGEEGAQEWASAYDVIGQGLEPSPQRPVLAVPPQIGQRQLHQVGGSLGVTGRQRMRHRVSNRAVLGVPPARGPVEVRHLLWMLRCQSTTQYIGEEVVVPVPPPLRVKRYDEQVAALERFQCLVPVGPASQGIAQRAAQLMQHGGGEEEAADVVGLATQYLLHQIIQDEPVTEMAMVTRGGRWSSRYVKASWTSSASTTW